MTKGKKLSNEEAQMLAEAEKAAKAGFDQKTKQLNEEIYGSITTKFDPTVEMKDKASMENDSTVETSSHRPEEDPSLEGEEPGDTVPEDPEERMKWTAKMLQKVNPKAPGYNALRQWKQMHGDIFILNIQDKVFIYRYIKRQEWAQLQSSDSFNNMNPVQQEDHITERCVLWPEMNPMVKASMPAGALSMLAEQIRIQSMFLDPVQVANITLKL